MINWWVGHAIVDQVGKSSLIIDSIKDSLKVEGGIGLGGTKRHGNGGQAVTQTDRPELGAGAFFASADQYAVGAVGPRTLCGKGRLTS